MRTLPDTQARVRPDRHLHLGEGLAVGGERLGDHGVGHLVAELVRVSRQDGLGKADHDGNPWSCV